ncbi:DUF2169 domain-containing protein [Thalassomonas viridans]|uniref:DUF2169 domain-containing protein n=1 Tax=Thalassomonas viridans TaxID=137584 RepID=A0AAF0CDF5_9GAMM|nr:DUF2169 domain-containing protein [Thalassomonas viridans]WDE08069.1 DUF2169 domain-containing protein [Thalassomonas viridans]
MQIIKPGKLSLISKTYGFHGNRFAIGALCFFRLGTPKDKTELLTENSQWPLITAYLNNTVLDMGFAKPKGEFLIAGSACAPKNQAVRKMAVSACIGKMKKRLKVIGDRHWDGGLLSPASYPKAFRQMPLRYANAYGGETFPENPLGKGVITPKNKNPESGYYDLPNLYLHKENTGADRQKRSVAGFGPLDICGPQRARYQGTYDKKWLDTVHPGFPDDTRKQLFNAAPEDQHIKGFFHPGETYRLEGMHSDFTVIEGTTPDIQVRAFICQQQESGEDFKEVKTAIDTLWFFPELLLGVAIYRGVAEVNDSDGLDVTKLLLGCDGVQDTPREADYFRQVMALRSDSKTALAHVFNESQLMPVKTAAQKSEEAELYARAKAEQQEKAGQMQAIQQEKLQSAHPDTDIPTPEPQPQDAEAAPEPIPQELLEKGDIDLSSYVEFTQARLEQARADMEKQLDQAEQQKKQHAKDVKKETESVQSMQARVNNVVYVVATDLAKKAEHEATQAKQQKPGWAGLLPCDFPQTDHIQQAATLMAGKDRQARQNSPQVTVLPVPLPPDGPAKMRAWVMELLQSGTSLAGRDLAGADLSGIDFSGLDLRDVMLEQANLTGCDFSECRLDGAVLTGALVDKAIFSAGSLFKANLSLVQGKKALFNNADLTQANLTGSKLTHSDFSDAVLNRIQASETDLRFSSLPRVSCERGHFVQAKLDHCNWRQANINSCIFLQPAMTDTDWQQVVFNKTLMVEGSAKGINLCGVHAEKVQFSSVADFSGADISGGKWLGCGFRSLNLTGSDFRGSVFKNCDFGESDLSGGLFNEVLLDNCIMTRARFDESDCRGILINETALRKCLFNRVDLRQGEIVNTDLSEAVFNDCQTRDFKQRPVPSIK